MNDQGKYVCVVESVITERGGGCIFKARLDDDRIVRVLVPCELISDTQIGKGQSWEVTGIEADHPKYGTQIKVFSFLPVSPITTKNIERFIAHAPEMRGIGIGKGKAQALADCLGADLVKLLNSGDAKALAERAEGIISDHSAEALCQRWAVHAARGRTIAFLDEHGIAGRMASLIQGVYGERTEKALKEDPYRLVAFRTPRRAAWLEIKDVAQKLGVAPGDDRELLGAVEFGLYKQHSQGHTAVARPLLVDEVAPLVGGKKQAEKAIELAFGAHMLVEHRGALQHVGARQLEDVIERNLRARVCTVSAQGSEASQGALFGAQATEEEIEGQIAQWEQSNFTLNPEQRQAVSRGLMGKLSVITGGAGVGKTSALRALAEVARHHGRDVHFLALAGRAAMRIQEATGFEAKTIAGFVSAVGKGKRKAQESGIVIIDEASMISLPELIRVLRCVGNASVVLVGDDYQLPPISFGEVFPHLVESESIPVTKLTRVYRQSEKTGIPTASKKVRVQEMPDFVPYLGPSEGVSFIGCDRDEIESNVLEVYQALSAQEECQVICMTNVGLAGTKQINKLFQARFTTDNDQLVRDGVMVGDPVIHLVNDYEEGLCNGSLGIVRAINTESGKVAVKWDDGLVNEVPLTGLHISYEIAYGITCHKAQGSQFSKIIVPVRSAKNLDSRMLYTAITRARTQVVLVGDLSAFTQAVLTPPGELRRCVGFSADFGIGQVLDAAAQAQPASECRFAGTGSRHSFLQPNIPIPKEPLGWTPPGGHQ